MSNAYRHQFDRLWALLKDSRPIAFGLLLARITDHPKAAVMLSQLVYWTRHGRDVDANHGWIFKTREQWWQETGLSRDEQETARKRLNALGLIEEWRGGRPAKLWYRLKLDHLSQALQAYQRSTLPLNLSFDFLRADERATREAFGPTVAYHRVLADLTGGVNAALLLSRLIHMQRRLLDGGQAWISVTAADWKSQLAMNRRQLEKAKHKLRQLGLIEEVLSQHRQKRVFTQVNVVRLYQLLQPCLQQAQLPSETSNTGAQSPATDLTGDTVRNPPSNFSQWEIPVGGKRTLPDGGKHPLPVGGKQPLQLGENVHDRWRETFIANAPASKTTSLITSPTTGAQARASGLSTPGAVGVGLIKSEPAEPTASEAVAGTLIWPDFVRQAEQQSIVLYWNRGALDAEARQAMLDEMAVRHRRQPIQNPAGYVRRLIERAQCGEFVPEVAHQEVARRERQQQVQRALQEAEAGAAVPAAPVAQRTDPAVARAHLAEALAALRGGRAVRD